MNNLAIKHDVDKHLFYVKVKGGNAELKYDRHSNQYLDYKKTFVPKESRKMGVGSSLVKHALEFAKNRNLNVKPSCPFVADYINNHQQQYEQIVLK